MFRIRLFILQNDSSPPTEAMLGATRAKMNVAEGNACAFIGGPPSSPTCVVEDERIVIAAGRRNDKCKFVIERVSRPRNPHHRESDPTIAEKKCQGDTEVLLVRVTFNPNAVKKKTHCFLFSRIIFCT